MALVDDLRHGPQEAARKPGKVQRWLDRLDSEERAAVDEAIADPEWDNVPLFELFASSGLACDLQTFYRYRKALHVAR